MANITISEEKFNKVISDVEALIEDVASLLDQNEVAKRRLSDIKYKRVIGKSEKELDDYLRKRGIKFD